MLCSDEPSNPRFRDRRRCGRNVAASLAAKRECIGMATELFGDRAQALEGRLELITYAAEVARRRSEGLWLEFGVHEGKSLNMIAEIAETTVYGFDSFRGLPKDWVVGEMSVRKAAPSR